jgi:hypothetical protein
MKYIKQLDKSQAKKFSAAMHVIMKDSTGNFDAYNRANNDLQDIRKAKNWDGQQLQNLVSEYLNSLPK